jgi:hypothetical protein
VSETNIAQAIRLALSRGAVRLFRNQIGALEDKTGRWVSFGLHVGSGDLIGWQTIEITPDMVGMRVARFLSIEVKRPKARTDKKRAEDQANWRRAVNDAGGVAIEARSVSDAEAALK